MFEEKRTSKAVSPKPNSNTPPTPEIKLTGVNATEQKNVLLIYECLKNIKGKDKKPREVADFIPALRSGSDPWASLREKTYVHELDAREMHALITAGEFRNDLLALGQNDPEKAALITKSPFLESLLPHNQLVIRAKPAKFHQLCGAIFTGIGGFMYALIRNPLMAIWNLCGFLVRPFITLFGKIAIFLGCASPDLFWRRYSKPRMIIEDGLLAILYTLYTVIHPFFCLFVGGYYGGKRGIYEPRGLMNLLKSWEYQLIQKMRYPFCKILTDFPGLEAPVHWRDTIAENALKAKQPKQPDEITAVTTEGALAIPPQFATRPGLATTITAYTALTGNTGSIASDYGSRSPNR